MMTQKLQRQLLGGLGAGGLLGVSGLLAIKMRGGSDENFSRRYSMLSARLMRQLPCFAGNSGLAHCLSIPTERQEPMLTFYDLGGIIDEVDGAKKFFSNNLGTVTAA